VGHRHDAPAAGDGVVRGVGCQGEEKVSADLHVHAFVDGTLTEEDFRCFFGHTIGSKWGPSWDNMAGGSPGCQKALCKHWTRISTTDNVWVGEVSWLKAAFLDDPKTFVPDVVAAVVDAIGEELPVINDDLIARVTTALNAGNATGYRVSLPDKVLKFLEAHREQRAFTVSW
jgi:hypothetical protein